MATIEVPLGKMGAMIVEDDEKRRRSIYGVLLEAAYAGLEILAEAAPKDTGALRQSGHIEIVDGHPAIVFDAPHAVFLEMGTRPHFPPLAPLIEWVKRHASLFDAATEKDFERIARAIQRKIGEEGIEPTWFIRSNLPALSKVLAALLEVRLGWTR